MIGKVHSFETFATLDGGGIRGMVFLSGCPLRCCYCHNPDTWFCVGKNIESDEVVKRLAKNKRYYKNGGITISGGEPLMQPEFLEDLLIKFKKENLHTAVDTSGSLFPKNIKTILKNTDLLILDLKFYNDELYKKYTGGSIKNVLKIIELANNFNTLVLLRTVIVPDINDNFIALDNYLKIAKTIKNLKEYELLAYHTMGKDKYKKLQIKYPLENTKALDNKKLNSLQNYVNLRLGN